MEEHAIATVEKVSEEEELTKRQIEEPMEETEPSDEFYYRKKRTIKFDVSQLPIPQGSTRAFIINNKPVITSTSKKLSLWRNLVASEAQKRVDEPISGPVAITLKFRLPRPKSAPKKAIYPSKRPDLDKLVRAVLDALTHVIIADDSQVVSLTATKDYGSAGVLIEVDEIEV